MSSSANTVQIIVASTTASDAQWTGRIVMCARGARLYAVIRAVPISDVRGLEEKTVDDARLDSRTPDFRDFELYNDPYYTLYPCIYLNLQTGVHDESCVLAQSSNVVRCHLAVGCP